MLSQCLQFRIETEGTISNPSTQNIWTILQKNQLEEDMRTELSYQLEEEAVTGTFHLLKTIVSL